MANQSYANHVKFYPPHHFVFYPLLLIAIGASVSGYRHNPDQQNIWLMIIIGFVFIGWSTFMMRQHYGLGNQDRIVRLEMRFRYFALTGERLEPFEAKLRFGQLAALRFAPDEELPALLQRALKENLSPADIKKSILNWLPDHMRV